MASQPDQSAEYQIPPYQGLDNAEFEHIRKKLRPEGTNPLIAEFPPLGETFYPLVRLLLSQVNWFKPGWFIDYLKGRFISGDRIPFALVNGTDRDSTSQVNFHGKQDGEIEAMIRHGLNPNTDRDLVTYVSELPFFRGLTVANSPNPGLLIYAPEALVRLGPAFDLRDQSNSHGLHMFKDRRLIQPSLLLVLKPKEK